MDCALCVYQNDYDKHLQILILHMCKYLGWPLAMAREWTRYVDTNVCAVDWSYLSRKDPFTAAIVNTRVVGNYIATFASQLIKYGVQPKDLSITGHSLGGQVAGFVGQNLINLNITMGRIYGMHASSKLSSGDTNFRINFVHARRYGCRWSTLYIAIRVALWPDYECK